MDLRWVWMVRTPRRSAGNEKGSVSQEARLQLDSCLFSKGASLERLAEAVLRISCVGVSECA